MIKISTSSGEFCFTSLKNASYWPNNAKWQKKEQENWFSGEIWAKINNFSESKSFGRNLKMARKKSKLAKSKTAEKNKCLSCFFLTLEHKRLFLSMVWPTNSIKLSAHSEKPNCKQPQNPPALWSAGISDPSNRQGSHKTVSFFVLLMHLQWSRRTWKRSHLPLLNLQLTCLQDNPEDFWAKFVEKNWRSLFARTA